MARRMVTVRPWTCLRYLVAAHVALLLAYWALFLDVVPTHGLITEGRPFDMDGEGSVAAWLGGAQLLVAGVLCWLCRGADGVGAAATNLRDRAAVRRVYAVLAAGCVFLSMDEVAQVHEGLMNVFRRAAPAAGAAVRPAEDLPVFVLYGTVAAALAWTCRAGVVPFFRDPRGRALLITGAVVLVGSGVGIDMLFPAHGQAMKRPAYVVKAGLEETGELLGAALVVAGLLWRVGGARLTTAPATRRDAASEAVSGSPGLAPSDGSHPAPTTAVVSIS